MRKAGFFVQQVKPEVEGAIYRVKPRLIISLAHEKEFWREIKNAFGDRLFLVGRLYEDNQHWLDINPRIWAQKCAALGMPYDAFLTFNEPPQIFNDVTDELAARHDDWCCEFLYHINQYGYDAVALNIANGHLHKNRIVNLFPNVCQTFRWIGVHEYSALCMWDQDPKKRRNPDDVPRNEGDIIGRWYCERYVDWYAGIVQRWPERAGQVQVIPTECGICMGVINGYGDIGWRGNVEERHYKESLIWYFTRMNARPECWGGAIFIVGAADPKWGSFETLSFIDWLLEIPQVEDQPIPPPPEPPPPPPEPPPPEPPPPEPSPPEPSPPEEDKMFKQVGNPTWTPGGTENLIRLVPTNHNLVEMYGNLRCGSWEIDDLVPPTEGKVYIELCATYPEEEDRVYEAFIVYHPTMTEVGGPFKAPFKPGQKGLWTFSVEWTGEPQPPPEPPPSPPEQTYPLEVWDMDGQKLSQADAQAKIDYYGLNILTPPGLKKGDKYFKVIAFFEKRGFTALTTSVLNENAEPWNNIDVAFYWPDAPDPPDPPTVLLDHDWRRNFVHGPTNVNGDIGPSMGRGAYHDPHTPGPHEVWIRHPQYPCQVVTGQGMIGMTFHDHMDQMYQLVTYDESESPPPLPEPPPDGEPGSIDEIMASLREKAASLRADANDLDAAASSLEETGNAIAASLEEAKDLVDRLRDI